MEIDDEATMPSIKKLRLGSTHVHPNILDFLKAATYFLIYDTERRTMKLIGNDGGLSKILFECSDIMKDEAFALAEALSLPLSKKPSKEHPECYFGTRVPFVRLYHNGSTAAESLYNALVRARLPHAVVYGALRIEIHYEESVYKTPECSVERMRKIIDDIANIEMKPDDEKPFSIE